MCNPMPTRLAVGVAEKLQGALRQYDPSGVYDETFHEVSASIAASGSAGKLEISALVVWKRIPLATWWGDLLKTPDSVVRETTRNSFADGLTDAERVDILSGLPGCKTGTRAVLSAVLTAWDPEQFGVTDRRAKDGWRDNLRPRSCPCNIHDYLVFLKWLRWTAQQWGDAMDTNHTPREVDKALWVLGG